MGIGTQARGYIQISVTQLPDVDLRHLTSAIDTSISLPETLTSSRHVISGYTEWTASLNGHELSIGWDWAFTNAEVTLIHADEIRTNVQLIEEEPPRLRRRANIWLFGLIRSLGVMALCVSWFSVTGVPRRNDLSLRRKLMPRQVVAGPRS